MSIIMDFCLKYWREIIVVISMLVNLLIFIIRKRPKILTDINGYIKESVLELLPSWMFLVECEGHGAEKKSCVIDFALDHIKKLLMRDLTDDENKFFTWWISEQIEKILVTPEKKEG